MLNIMVFIIRIILCEFAAYCKLVFIPGHQFRILHFFVLSLQTKSISHAPRGHTV